MINRTTVTPIPAPAAGDRPESGTAKDRHSLLIESE